LQKSVWSRASVVAILIVIGGLVGLLPAAGARAATAPAANGTPVFHEHHGPNGEVDVNACTDEVAAGHAHCLARVRTDAKAKGAKPGKAGAAAPAGSVGSNGAYDPSYLQSAYNAPSATGGQGQTVAIVDAYDNPNAEADLATYRSTFGLSPCTTANGCFRKVNQAGGTTYPTTSYSWAEEISLDLAMVSAICPNCHLLLVEATSNSMSDLGAAVNTAVAMGANVVSNSYGGPEYSGEVQDSARYFRHPGVAVVASTGDSGYGVQFPAASPDVTAVGGTSLQQATNTGTRNASETVWSGAGSGCSAYEAKPAWQHDAGCANRTVSDVAAVADPNTGVWVYLSYPNWGWTIFGGTSASAPIVAALYALAGNAAGTSTQMSALPYSAGGVTDVVSGSNGGCGTYLCTGVAGYDGPTGLGTPLGAAAFSTSSAGSSPQPTVPAPPQNLTVTAGNASAALAWSAPSTGSSVTYDLYRGTAAGGETLLRSGLTALSYSDSGLINGTTYYYAVTAVSSGGTSARSNEVAVRPAGVPGAPQNVTAKATSGVITLAWKAPSSNGGSPITGYTVLRSMTSNGEVAYASVSCTTTSCTFADRSVTSGKAYYYQVVALNATGSGARSAQATTKAR
jgi:subtilase family serine protease